MSLNDFVSFMQKVYSPVSVGELISTLSMSKTVCMFIKNDKSAYCFANDNFIQLMGLQKLDQLLSLNDLELSKNKSSALIYRNLDCEVIEEEKSLHVEEVISPEYNQPVYKTMQGTLYPLFEKGHRANFILGLVTPTTQLLKLDFDTIFRLDHKALYPLITKRRYSIKLSTGTVILSKMEIVVLIQLIKGHHAGEIAQSLNIKQNTVESYLINVKNKLNIDSKSKLIQLVLSEKFLEQIIV